MISAPFTFACRVIALLRDHPDFMNKIAIAQALGVAQRYGEANLQQMRRLGLLQSRRGPGHASGYILSAKGERLSLLDLFELYHPDQLVLKPLLLKTWSAIRPDQVAIEHEKLARKGLA